MSALLVWWILLCEESWIFTCSKTLKHLLNVLNTTEMATNSGLNVDKLYQNILRCNLYNQQVFKVDYRIIFNFKSFKVYLTNLHSEIWEEHNISVQIKSVQSLSRVRLFATPWITAHQASVPNTNSGSSLRLTCIESVMPSSHLILCCPLLLLPTIPPSISLFQWVNSSHEVAKVLEFQL